MNFFVETKSYIFSEMSQRIGIQAGHSVLKRATQSNLSMFHVSGGISGSILPQPSLVDILDGKDYKNCYMSAKLKPCETKEINIEKKVIIGSKFSDFLLYISKSKFLSKKNNLENIFYNFLAIPIPEKFIRFYLDPYKFCSFGYKLKELASLLFSEYIYYCSPEFMGIIDIDTENLDDKKVLESLNLEMNIGGSQKIKHCFIKENTLYAIGSDLEFFLLLGKYIDTKTIYSNNIKDVEKTFGIGAVRRLLIELIDDKKYKNVIPDFMVRSGMFVPFKKGCIGYYKRGFISEISFERASSDIIEKIPSPIVDPLESIYSRIWSNNF